eukprot:5593864-Pleurochrysis_carterae.AAC.2
MRSVKRWRAQTSRVMPTTRQKRAMCAASQGIQQASAIDSTCSRTKADASTRPYEHVRSMGVQIGGKRVANFAHLSDLNDDHAHIEVRQALPASEMFHVRDAIEVLEEALYRSDPDSGEIAEIVARMDISASEEEDAGGRGRTPGAFPHM